jgi:steroid delta-isomerase
MPTPEQITQTVDRYLELLGKGATDEIADLYLEDATVEDPVGGEVHIGRQAIHGFYSNIAGAQCNAEMVTLRALGHEAAFLWRLTVKFGDSGGMRIEIISVMTFDDDARIASMKAYWTQDNVTQL